MKTTIAFAAIVIAAAAAPAFADDRISVLSQESGVSERTVQMLLGDRSAFAGYRHSYDQSLRKFRRGLGEENYQRAISGQPLLLPRGTTPATAVAVLDEDEQPTP